MQSLTKKYWTTSEGLATLDLINLSRRKKDWRPTAISVITNHRNEFLIVRRNTHDRCWMKIQGEVEQKDETPVHTSFREIDEEASIHASMIEWSVEYLMHDLIPYVSSEPRRHDTGYRIGGLYYCCGFKIKEGVQISLSSDLLDYRWLPYEEAIHTLREQPDVEWVPKTVHLKVEKILIPAMNALREYEQGLSLLKHI